MESSTTTESDVPLVSVCIPTYLGAEHLTASIDSVLTQSLCDFELIIIDDNSPDETAELLGRYDDDRIRYLKNPENLGPEGNWNRCLEEARGRYFKLLPQDDILYPDTLKRQVSVLEHDTEARIALVFGARNIINAAGETIMRRGYPGGKEGDIQSGDLVRRCVRRGTNLIGEPGSVLTRRNLADEIGPFDGDIPYVIDLDYWVRLLRHGDGYYLADPVSAFRISSGSWSVKIGTRQCTDYQRFISKLRQQSIDQLHGGDILIGNFMANANNALRVLFYHFALPRGS